MKFNKREMKRWIKQMIDFIYSPISKIILKFTICSMKEEMYNLNTFLMEIEIGKALILAPHVDDDFIGCGGIIYQILERDKTVDIVYLTDSGKRGTGKDWEARSLERKAEAIHVADIAGISTENLHFLSGKDGDLMNSDIELELIRVIKKTEPEMIFVPIFIDTHKDHIACVGKLMKIIKIQPEIFENIKIYFYESQSPITQKYSNITVDITPQWKRKRNALNGYPSQYNNFAFVEAMNQTNGIIFNKPYCEVFLKVSPKDLLYLEPYYPEEFFRIREELYPVRNSASLLQGYKSSLRMKEFLNRFQ